MSLSAFAPAKINLFLHVGAPAPDGYHPLSSWMVFADVGDEIELVPDRGEAPVLVVEGPLSAGVPADSSNLVLRARDLWLGDLAGSSKAGLRLTKHLPVASGIGGGSSDAAATLRLMNQYGRVAEADLERMAASLGADVPACVRGRSLLATGRGERLADGPAVPHLPAVLVNSGVDCPTGPVFKLYDEGRAGGHEAPALPSGFSSVRAVASFLSGCRNDLEKPAQQLRPKIGEALHVLRHAPQTLFARMSGSGATCFALCADLAAADDLAHAIQAKHSGWWVQPCRLGGPWLDFTSP